jgi:predicted metal-dependent hydrolase
MPFDWTEGALAEGLRCYCNREFFDAHEHWEGVWLKCAEPEKTFLQALIQITAAFHHLQRGNPAGTVSLLRAALQRLDGFSAEYGGVAVEELRASIRTWLEALKHGSDLPELPFPKIR